MLGWCCSLCLHQTASPWLERRLARRGAAAPARSLHSNQTHSYSSHSSLFGPVFSDNENIFVRRPALAIECIGALCGRQCSHHPEITTAGLGQGRSCTQLLWQLEHRIGGRIKLQLPIIILYSRIPVPSIQRPPLPTPLSEKRFCLLHSQSWFFLIFPT